MFRRVLIANRGEIALRILRSLRTMGIEAVVIHGKEDRLSLPVRLADEAVYIPRSDPLASYLDIEAIVEAAKEVGADAVHPGYGFLAENPIFAERLEEEGITFIGPSADVLRLLGDKIAARDAMVKSGIPVAMGSDGPISDPEEAAMMAQIIGMQNAGQATGEEAVAPGQQPDAMGGPEGTPQQPTDLGATGTGGGNIGTGNVPQPGEDAFAGTPRLVEGAG